MERIVLLLTIYYNEYKILFKGKRAKVLCGCNGLVSVKGGKYLIMENNNYGFEVIKPFYKILIET